MGQRSQAFVTCKTLKGETYGSTKRNNSPSNATAEVSFLGIRPSQCSHAVGISRVCGVGFSIQPSTVSSRKNTEKPVFPTVSNFHSNRVAAKASVSDSRGSRQRIHCVGAHRAY